MYRDDLIRATKAAKSLTVEKISCGAKLSPMTVAKILAGKKNIEIGSLEKIAIFLEISLEDLFSSKKIENVV
jgi:transcriptional regulator with XRE-family HTH domain